MIRRSERYEDTAEQLMTRRSGLGATFHPDDVNTVIPAGHRDTMLDLILTWASLDGALRILLSRVLELDLRDGAELTRGMSSSLTFAELRRALKSAGASVQVLAIIKKHKRSYERHSRPRNRIAHARCAGVWTQDADYLVFALFERRGDDQLAIELVPLEEIERATRWGRAMTRVALKIANI